jgi:hypothetical protein
MTTRETLELLETMEAELHQEVYRELLDELANLVNWVTAFPGADVDIDVRLQVLPCGTHQLHIGDACYDTDHHGFWGCSSITANDNEVTLAETARDLVEQVLECVAMDVND